MILGEFGGLGLPWKVTWLHKDNWGYQALPSKEDSSESNMRN